MLLQFELDGQSCDAASYTFKLQHALSFSRLTLRTVSIQCGNDKLAQIWSYGTVGVTYDGTDGTRKLTAPLYLDMSSFLDSTHTAHYLPTGLRKLRCHSASCCRLGSKFTCPAQNN